MYLKSQKRRLGEKVCSAQGRAFSFTSNRYRVYYREAQGVSRTGRYDFTLLKVCVSVATITATTFNHPVCLVQFSRIPDLA